MTFIENELDSPKTAIDEAKTYNSNFIFQALLQALSSNLTEFAKDLAQLIDLEHADFENYLTQPSNLKNNYTVNPFTHEIITLNSPPYTTGHPVFCVIHEYDHISSPFTDDSLFENFLGLENRFSELCDKEALLASINDKELKGFVKKLCDGYEDWYLCTPLGIHTKNQVFTKPEGQNSIDEVFIFHPDPENYIEEIKSLHKILIDLLKTHETSYLS